MIDCLYGLISEFLAETGRDSGALRRIFHEYFEGLKHQDLYFDGDLIRFSSSPGWATLTIDEGAARLGLSRREAFDRIARGELRTARMGADVLLSERQVDELANRAP